MYAYVINMYYNIKNDIKNDIIYYTFIPIHSIYIVYT